VNVQAPTSNSAQAHKKNSKSQNPAQVIKPVSNAASKITASVLQRDGKKAGAHYNSIGAADRKTADDRLSEQSQSTVI